MSKNNNFNRFQGPPRSSRPDRSGEPRPLLIPNSPPWRRLPTFPRLACLLLLGALLFPAALPAAEKPRRASGSAPFQFMQDLSARDALVFANGDYLYGDLHAIDTNKLTVWKHPDAAEPITFHPSGLTEVYLRTQTTAKGSHNCSVQLANEDELTGNLLECDAERILLDTWYAGQLSIPRSLIRAIFPVPTNRPPLFAGPAGAEGWTIGKVNSIAEAGEWKYRDGAFYAARAASIARDIKLPDMASLQFDLAWKGTFHFAIALYTDYLYPINLASKDNEPDFGGFYSLQLNSYSANLLPIKKNEPLKYVGQPASVPAFNQKNSARLEIRVNKAKNLIALLVDGTLIRQWVDQENFAGTGTGVRFVHQGQGAIKFSNVLLTEWDGQFEEKPAAAPDVKHDIVRLRNGDKVVGSLKTIQDGKVSFAMVGNTVDIPYTRVKQIEFSGENRPPNSLSAADVRVFFHFGGSLTFTLEKWDKDGVTASSPNFGAATFHPSAFARLQYKAD